MPIAQRGHATPGCHGQTRLPVSPQRTAQVSAPGAMAIAQRGHALPGCPILCAAQGGGSRSRSLVNPTFRRLDFSTFLPLLCVHQPPTARLPLTGILPNYRIPPFRIWSRPPSSNILATATNPQVIAAAIARRSAASATRDVRRRPVSPGARAAWPVAGFASR